MYVLFSFVQFLRVLILFNFDKFAVSLPVFLNMFLLWEETVILMPIRQQSILRCKTTKYKIV